MEGKNAKWVNLFHVLVVAPLLAYIGYRSFRNLHIQGWLAVLLLFLSVGVLGYHGYKFYQRVK